MEVDFAWWKLVVLDMSLYLIFNLVYPNICDFVRTVACIEFSKYRLRYDPHCPIFGFSLLYAAFACGSGWTDHSFITIEFALLATCEYLTKAQEYIGMRIYESLLNYVAMVHDRNEN